jgi:predicted DNA-binding transcriptional regulator YafY
MNQAHFGSTREEETKRPARLLQLIQMVALAPRRYPRRALADHFEISERMIQKDLQLIKHGLHLPLERSPDGYYFEDVPRLPTLQYTFAEALALLLAVQAARHVSGIASIELAAALSRLEALFPPAFAPLLQHLLAPPPLSARREHRQAMLELLNRALIEQRKVHMLYETGSRGGDPNERVIHPYHVLPYVRSWQLVAYCESRQQPRTFKMDRIQHATLLPDHYRLPDDFSLESYMGHTWGLMRGAAGDPQPVHLRFTPEAGRWVSEEQWHPSQRPEEQPDGSLHFHLHIAITPEFVAWLLYYGDQLQVLAPPDLRQHLADAHRRAAELND